MDRANRNAPRLADRIVIGALLLLTLILTGMQTARASELVPSVGMTRSTTGDGDVKAFAGLAMRGSVVPTLKSEIAIAYRNESRSNGDLNVRMWPVTASLWLAPVPMFYVGGGVGLYHTTYDYRESLGIPDETSQEFGTHVGGGFGMPIVPAVASLDMNARYVHLREKPSLLAPGSVKQSFWSAALGVAIKF